MLRDQRGFIMPLSMVFAIFIVMYILHMVILLQAEQNMLQERWEGLAGDLLVQNGEKAVLKESFQAGILLSGVYHFDEGAVNYHIAPLNDQTFEVTLDTKQTTLANRHVTFLYNPAQGDITSWKE